MRLFLFSDVHGNLHALDAVLKEAKTIGYDQAIFLGDAVGYGAFPNECVEKIRETAQWILRGNHDTAAFRLEEAEFFNPWAREAIEWTRHTLTQTNLEYLRGLPVRQRISPDLLVVHSTPEDPEMWIYLFGSEISLALSYLSDFEEWLCAYGHTHIPLLLQLNPKEESGEILGTKGVLRRGYRYFLNPGSVGQPRDGDPRAAFAILDTEPWTFTVYRVEYPIEKAQQAIRTAGLPEILAERLAYGQ